MADSDRQTTDRSSMEVDGSLKQEGQGTTIQTNGESTRGEKDITRI